MDLLVSPYWLAREIGAPDLVVLDASLFLDERDARAEFEEAHIPSARFLDLASLRDTDSPLPNTFPSAEVVTERMRSLGVDRDARIVVYDNSPLFSAARAWWLLRIAYGARQVAILDGGLRGWRTYYEVDSGRHPCPEGDFAPRPDLLPVADKSFMIRNLEERSHQVVDARPKGRFLGTKPDPHGVESGHIPGSRNLHYAKLLRLDGTYQSADHIADAFRTAGVDLSKPIVATCGSGVTAAVLVFAAHLTGKTNVKLYDGSWTEWASDPATPKETA